LSEALQRHLINDAVVANSGAQADALWRIRRSIVEFQPQAGGEIKHDVSVPISKVPDFIRRAGISVNKVVQDIRPVAYGHIGDGNIHYNLSPPLGMTRASFLKYTNQLHSAVYDVVADFDGSFAAEHGVGIVKKDELVRYRSDTEVDLMRQIKHLIDPEGLMNPGKVLHQED
jgi:FAD/FMN-containing dehydrogenase